MQMNIKNNVSDMKNYFKDLYEWEENMQKKKKTKKQVHKEVPIRGDVLEEERQAELKRQKLAKQQIFDDLPQEQTLKYKRDANTVQDYYKAWDKFDVEQEISKLDEKTVTPPIDPTKPQVKPKPNQKVIIKGGKSSQFSDINAIKEKVRKLHQANIFYQNGNYNTAIDLYSECIQLMPALDQPSPQLFCILLSNRA